jgi:hypothetical protein
MCVIMVMYFRDGNDNNSTSKKQQQHPLCCHCWSPEDLYISCLLLRENVGCFGSKVRRFSALAVKFHLGLSIIQISLLLSCCASSAYFHNGTGTVQKEVAHEQKSRPNIDNGIRLYKAFSPTSHCDFFVIFIFASLYFFQLQLQHNQERQPSAYGLVISSNNY